MYVCVELGFYSIFLRFPTLDHVIPVLCKLYNQLDIQRELRNLTSPNESLKCLL